MKEAAKEAKKRETKLNAELTQVAATLSKTV